MYALIDPATGQVLQFPYSITDLIRSRPDVCWPRGGISDELAATYNVIKVDDDPEPVTDHTESVVEDPPVKVGGKWVRQRRKAPAAQADLDARTRDKTAEVMAERDKRIQAFFWSELLTPTANAGQYRLHLDALRDVALQPGFPFTVTWPGRPT